MEHDLFRKPVSTFRDHTLAWLARSNGWPMVAVVPYRRHHRQYVHRRRWPRDRGRALASHIWRSPVTLAYPIDISREIDRKWQRRLHAASTRCSRSTCHGTALSRVRDAGADRADRLRFPRCRLDSSSMAVWPVRSCLDDSRAHPVLTACARSAGCRFGSTRSGDETFALGLLAGELACPADRFTPLPGRSL